MKYSGGKLHQIDCAFVLHKIVFLSSLLMRSIEICCGLKHHWVDKKCTVHLYFECYFEELQEHLQSTVVCLELGHTKCTSPNSLSRYLNVVHHAKYCVHANFLLLVEML
jgi:hypothetical protein